MQALLWLALSIPLGIMLGKALKAIGEQDPYAGLEMLDGWADDAPRAAVLPDARIEKELAAIGREVAR